MEFFNFDEASLGSEAHFVAVPGVNNNSSSCAGYKTKNLELLPTNDAQCGYYEFQTRPDLTDSGSKEPKGIPEPQTKSPNKEITFSSVFPGEQIVLVSDCDRKSSTRLPKPAVRILRNWLAENAHHPYLTEGDTQYLLQETGLTKTQIRYWLANSRKRKKLPHPSNLTPQPTEASSATQPNSGCLSWTPLQRWQNSPPEDEPALLSDVYQALVDRPGDYNMGPSLPESVSSNGYTGRKSSSVSSYSDLSITQPASVHSLDSNYSSTSELSLSGLFADHLSIGAQQPTRSKSKSRNRFSKRSGIKKSTLEEKNKGNKQRLFRCTFCTHTFATKYDWQRHEKSVHLNLDKWICAPCGATVTIDGATICAFCGASDPDVDHIESHDYSKCQGKLPQDRMFNRKDNLVQHLKLSHSAEFQPHMESWLVSIQEIRSRCGFCDSVFSTWKERNDHLSEHFKAGFNMLQWHGDWGFEQHVQEFVKNAMPPYLIGQESSTLDPWRPAFLPEDWDLASGQNSWANNHPEAFKLLYDHLLEYIIRQSMNGTFPSDNMIQNEARRLVYGSEDDWNQTSADNSIWLNVLKNDSRIAGLREYTDASPTAIGP